MRKFDLAYVAHWTPTRLRLRVPGRRHDVAYFDQIVRQLETHEGVVRAEASPLTGSITLRSRHQFDWSSLDLSAHGIAVADGPAFRLPLLRPATALSVSSAAAPVCLLPTAPARTGVDPAVVIVQLTSMVLTGRPLAGLVQWLAERLLQSLLSRLLAARSQPA